MERIYDWKNVKDLTELSWIPDRYDIEEKMLFRTPLLLINHLMWNQLVDYRFYNEINSYGDSVITVRGYYTASIYHLRKALEIEIPANTPFNEELIVKNYSKLREESVHQARLENCLIEEESEGLRQYIQNMHRIPDINVYCTKDMEEIKINGDGSIQPYDRILVVWTIDLILGLYREDIAGNINLVGCSDYLLDTAVEIYPKSNNYWIDRTKKETLRSGSAYNHSTFSFPIGPIALENE